MVRVESQAHRDKIRGPGVELRGRPLMRGVVVSVDWMFVVDERWSGHQPVTFLSLFHSLFSYSYSSFCSTLGGRKDLNVR